jgi:hypothetical protein
MWDDGKAELVYGGGLMRILLALMAVLALVASPVTAAAAQAACGQTGPGGLMAGMRMPSADQGGASKAADPCCNYGGQHKQTANGCAQACATSCAVASALPSSSVSITRAFTRAPVTSARLVSVQGHEPSGPERPPKSMA